MFGKVKPIIVVSDLHLGAGPEKEKRERDFIDFIKKIDNANLVLLGDIFDFWIEYRSVVYKRYIKVLCALMNFMEKGNRIYFVPGNHDFYNTEYLRNIGFDVKYNGLQIKWKGRKVFLHHGDVFSLRGRVTRFFYGNPVTRFLFKLLHPDVGLMIANSVSKTPYKVEGSTHGFMPEGTEKLFKEYDIVITGHTHSPGIKKIANGKYYVNAGEWLFKRNYIKITEDEIILFNHTERLQKIG